MKYLKKIIKTLLKGSAGQTLDSLDSALDKKIMLEEKEKIIPKIQSLQMYISKYIDKERVTSTKKELLNFKVNDLYEIYDSLNQQKNKHLSNENKSKN